MTPPQPEHEDSLADAARRAAARARRAADDPEPSLGRRIGQIGVLGWTIALPILAGVLGGRWLDRLCGTGALLTAALALAGAAAGVRAAWLWMQRQ